MFRKALLVATASAFFAAVGVPDTSFAPQAAFAASKCGAGMRANWRGKCVKEKVAKRKPAAKSYQKKSPMKRRKRSKAKNG
jgi:hypothetical protein